MSQLLSFILIWSDLMELGWNAIDIDFIYQQYYHISTNFFIFMDWELIPCPLLMKVILDASEVWLP